MDKQDLMQTATVARIEVCDLCGETFEWAPGSVVRLKNARGQEFGKAIACRECRGVGDETSQDEP